MFTQAAKKGPHSGGTMNSVHDQATDVTVIFLITVLFGNIPYLSAKARLMMRLSKIMIKKYTKTFHVMETADLLSDTKVKDPDNEMVLKGKTALSNRV